MNEDKIGYFAKQVAEDIGITKPTLRRWCLELEKAGYEFERNEKDRRIYFERDYKAIRELKSLTDNSVPFVNAINAVIAKFTDDVNTPQTPSVHEPEMRLTERQFHEYMSKVAEESAKRAVAEAWQQIEKAIDAKLSDQVERRDRQIVQEMDKLLEQRRIDTAATEEKRGFWFRLFGKGEKK